jgi:hypothetical protein
MPMKMGKPGIGVDAHGNEVIDPTANVLSLVDAAVTRIDDMADLRAKLSDEQVKRLEAEGRHLEEIAKLRAEYSKDTRHLEADRLDKIRSVDVANAAATAAQLLSAVTTLATTQQATAETLRNQVASTATAVANQTERVINPIIERLSLLERATAATSGKSEGLSQGAGILLGVITFISSLLGIAAVLYAVLK